MNFRQHLCLTTMFVEHGFMFVMHVSFKLWILFPTSGT